MSDMRQALSRHTDAAARPVADAMATEAHVAVTASAIRTGRRQRAVAQAGVAASVAVVAAGALVVLPHVDTPEPAIAPSAGPYLYDVGADTGAFEVEEPEVRIHGEGEVRCGEEIALEPGVTVHHASAFDRGPFVAARLTTLGELTDMEPPATPQPLDPDSPDGPWTGWDPATVRWDAVMGGAVNAARSAALLMDGDVVVGIAEGSSVASGPGVGVAGQGSVPVPRVGECPGAGMTWADIRSLERGDASDTLLVTQFWGMPGLGQRTRVGESVLLATVVVDPTQPANTALTPTEVREDWNSAFE